MNLTLFLIGMCGIICFLAGIKSGRALIYGKALNLNTLAKTVTMLEGKKKSLTIAQVKEVIARTFDVLSRHNRDTIYLTVTKNN